MTLEEMQNIDIRNVKAENLVDIQTIKLPEELEGKELRNEFLRQVKNPYCYRVGNIIVKSSYSGDGVTLNERFQELVLSV